MKRMFLCMVFGILTMSASNVSGWTILTIDNGGLVGWGTSIAIDSYNKVHISYIDHGNSDLKYTTNASGTWEIYTIEAGGVGGQSSIAIDSYDKVHISYYDIGNGYLKYATNASGSWETYIIDSSAADVGAYNSVAIDSYDKVHISYHDIGNGYLKYATNASGSWETYIIDSSAADVGETTAIAIDSINKIHISYLDYTNTTLKYATNTSGSWETYTIDNAGQVGWWTSVAIDSSDGVHISYMDYSNNQLKYATNASGSWETYIIDGAAVGPFTLTTSIGIDLDNKVLISYYDNNTLKYATNASGSWETKIIDSAENVGMNTSIAIDSNNGIHISYLDWTNSALKYAMNARYVITTAPLGLQVIVDGYSYTAPHTFDWVPDSSHTLSVASPQSGASGTRYVYSSWSDGGDQTHAITAPSSSTTYTATFSTQHELTITSSPLGGGTVTPSPMGDQSGIACIALVGVVCAGYYSNGTLVTLTPTPITGYTFSGWLGDLSGTTNPTTITMNGPKNVVANFTQDQYTLTVNIAPQGAGSVGKNPDKTTYTYGEQVQLTATANPGYTFSSWSGDASGSANPITITMNGNESVAANFTQDQYTLTVNISPPGAGLVTKVPDKTTYVYGDAVTLTATANAGYTFSNWSGDATGSSNPVTVTISGNKNVTANFTQNQYTLTVNIAPSGSGSITRNPNKSTYVYGDVVELTANAATGYSFSNWSGDASGITNPVTLTITGNKTVTANFIQNQYTLTVNINLIGAGSVNKSPDKATYFYGDMVQLTATANPGYTFSNWSGNVTGSTNPVTVNINGNKNVTASFTQNQHTLTVIITPSGSGSVTKTPDKATYGYGDQVTLKAVPNSGYTFGRWSGDVTGRTNPITLTIDKNKSVTAHFAKIHEIISTPTTPSGPTSGTTSTSYTYFTGDSYSSLGHSVQYLFDWGDGTYSDWSSSTSASKSWTSPGSYIVRAQARSNADTSAVSDWSPGLCVTINTTQMFNLLLNPDFESGPLNWVQSSSSQADIIIPDPYAHSGDWFAWMGGVENGEDYIYQDVTIPSNATTAYVDFWYWNDTEETTSTKALDTMKVEIRRPSDNALLRTLVTLSNLDIKSEWILSDRYDVSEFIGRTIRLKLSTKNNDLHPTIFWIDDIGLWVEYPSAGDVTANRDLPDYYTPSVPLSVAITITPSETTQIYAVEDTPPNGWIVSEINEEGQWDNIKKKVKWGPFTDNQIRTLSYQVTPKSGDTGPSTFSGLASFDGSNIAIRGDSIIECGSFHPADTGRNFEISIDEVTAYWSAWKTGQTWPVPPNPIPIAYVTNAGYLWKLGELYQYNGKTDPPWIPGAPAQSPSHGNQSSIVNNLALAATTARRALSNCYSPSVVMPISVTVTPGRGAQVYAVEESPPVGWTISDINENGGWDDVNKKVKWGPFFDRNSRILTYKVTPPSDETGAKAFSGTASFDGKNVTIGGNLMLRECTSTLLPDLTGQWTTPLTQTCRNTRKGQKCTVNGVLTISNIGNSDASSSHVGFYLSDDGTYDEADTPKKSVATGKIKAGKNKNIKFNYSFPAGENITGKYIIAVIDKYNSVAEIDETNNIVVFGPIQ